VVTLFQSILDYNKASFPNHALEMRNPHAVMLALDYHNRRAEIEEMLVDNFGPCWREDYRKSMVNFDKTVAKGIMARDAKSFG